MRSLLLRPDLNVVFERHFRRLAKIVADDGRRENLLLLVWAPSFWGRQEDGPHARASRWESFSGTVRHVLRR